MNRALQQLEFDPRLTMVMHQVGESDSCCVVTETHQDFDFVIKEHSNTTPSCKLCQ
jgi:hypothetical protein